MKRLGATLSAVVALVPCAAAVIAADCGGTTGAQPDSGAFQDSGVDAGADVEGADVVAFDGPPCPAQVPATGSACATPGALCEYGTCADVGNDALRQCASSGWTVVFDGNNKPLRN